VPHQRLPYGHGLALAPLWFRKLLPRAKDVEVLEGEWRTHQELNLRETPVNSREFQQVDTKMDMRTAI